MSILRTIKKEMDVFSQKYPILVLTGPRQSGKTHFLKVRSAVREALYDMR